jgi:hypothetical protein
MSLGLYPSDRTDYLPFRSVPTSCERCFGIGLRISPSGKVERCPTLQLGDDHMELRAEGKRIVRAVEMLRRRGLEADPRHFELARSIGRWYDTTRPCSAADLGTIHFSYMPPGEGRRREVTKAIRFLREIWFLPVGSRKDKPAGYWIVTDEQDFKEWVERATAEPITTLSTIHRLARANWPEYAEQIEMKFWQDVETDDRPDDGAPGRCVLPAGEPAGQVRSNALEPAPVNG